jgi:putative ABC transport system substrate-binding protein
MAAWIGEGSMRHDRRRLLTFSIVCVFLVAGAGVAAGRDERPGPPLRVGLLLSGFEPSYAQVEQAFLGGMRDAGFVEGRNLTVERRYAHLQPDRMAGHARDLAALNLDAIVTGCTGSTRAVQRATSRIPIVMASVADPVGQGFVRSLAQPGTNVTGRSSQSRALVPKMLELLRGAVPRARRIAVLVNTLNTVHEPLWTDAVAAAPALGADLIRVEMRGPAELDAALARLASARADALFVLPDDPALHNLRARLVARVSALGLPSLFGMREFVDEGGLMSYGERFADTYRHAAPYVAKVTRGTNPAELPIEQPTHFELVINLRTAAALGLTIPRVVLLRASATVR